MKNLMILLILTILGSSCGLNGIDGQNGKDYVGLKITLRLE